MAYLDLNPVIVAIRERPDEFEMMRGTLHHRSSGHSFEFTMDGTMRVHAECDCASLMTRPGESALFKAAYDNWQAAYWRPIEINREFAGHFRRSAGWQRLCARALTLVLEYLQPAPARRPVLVRRSISR
jgi:hypothetical protein